MLHKYDRKYSVILETSEVQYKKEAFEWNASIVECIIVWVWRKMEASKAGIQNQRPSMHFGLFEAFPFAHFIELEF